MIDTRFCSVVIYLNASTQKSEKKCGTKKEEKINF